MNSLRTEGIRLYRDIMRATKFFNFRHPSGELWSKLLRENARKEFDQAKNERDPQMITRMLLVGRDALNKTMEKVVEKSANIKPPNSNPNSNIGGSSSSSSGNGSNFNNRPNY